MDIVKNSDSFENFRKKNLRKLSGFETVTNKILSLVAKDTRLYSNPKLDLILSTHPRLIVVFNHSSPLSWIPAPCLLASHLNACGGGGRTPIAVMDRFFFAVPGLKQLAKYITQSSKPLSFNELVQHFEDLGTADLVVFPEGSNAFFGEPTKLQPFRSIRFVEIAMRTKTPFLLCVHRGSENWGKAVRIDPRGFERLPGFAQTLLGRRLKAQGILTVPLLPKRMPLFSMRCELFQTDPLASVRDEARRVHEHMRLMLEKLDRDLLDDKAGKSAT